MIVIKIAYRNVVKNKWRSILIGIVLFISSFFLLVSNAAMNGIEDQVIRGYVNYQSGHVPVMWSGMKDVSPTDPSRFLHNIISFSSEQEAVNLAAIDRLEQFMEENQGKVLANFPSILRLGRYSSGEHNDQFVLFGLTEEHAQFLQNAKTLSIVQGKLCLGIKAGICISEYVSQETGLDPGDWITLSMVGADKEIREQDFLITGLYANGAGYDNYFVFMDQDEARELSGVPHPLFDINRVYLEDISKAEEFARALNEHLADNSVLYAESYQEASPFYTNNSKSMRAMFNGFLFFMLVVIAVGLLATIRMNLFERMKEFGTLRAIGYSRARNYAVIFFEMFILAAVSLTFALILAGVLVGIVGQAGIYVGTGPISYGLGGERFWPDMRFKDIALAVTAITAFSLFSTIGPGLNICYQKITDLILKRQRKMFLPAEIIKSWRGIEQ